MASMRLQDGAPTLLVSLLGIGDIVMCTPAIRLLHERLPGSRLGFLAPQGFSQVLAHFEGIERLHEFSKGGNWWQRIWRARSLSQELRPEGYQQAVVFGNYNRLEHWLLRAGIPAGGCHVLRMVERDGIVRHLADQFHSWAAGLVGAEDATRSLPALFPGPEEQAAADALLPVRCRERPFLAVHIGNSTFRRRRFALGGTRISHRAWPLENWRVCLPMLVEQLDLDLVLTGSAKEGAIAEQLLADAPEVLSSRIHNLSGQTPPLVLAAVLGRAAAYLGADTGPTHVAAATGIPVVVLIGPTHPQVSGPLLADPSRLRVLHHDVACSPCGRKVRKLCHDNLCLRGIEPASVVDAVRELLGR